MNPLRRLLALLKESSGPEFKGRLVQIFELSELMLRGHVHPSEYFAYGFSRREMKRSDMARYLGNHDHWNHVLPTLNQRQWKKLVQNKWFFQLHYEGLGLLPLGYGLYHPLHGVTSEGARLRSASDLRRLIKERHLDGFVAKPAEGWKGEGVTVVKQVSADGATCIAQDGTEATIEELTARFGRIDGGATRPGIVIQERLVQDESMDEIAPNGTHTIRVVTIVDRDGKVHIPFATIKMGVRGAMVDNWAAGAATMAFIDLRNGTVDAGVSLQTGRTRLTHHVGSGIRFAGKPVPRWGETVEAVLRMAQYSTGLRSIGWDLIITEDGPRIIEGNAEWDLVTHQWMDLPILQPRMVELLKEFNLSVYAPRLPPIRPLKALKLLGLW